MISQIPNSLLRLFLRQKGWACPSCRARQRRDKFSRPCVETLFRCERCDWSGSLGQIMAGAVGLEGSKNESFVEDDPELMAKPVGKASGIVKSELRGGRVAYEVPASGKSGGLLFFSILWLGFMVVFTSASVAGFVTFSSEGGDKPWPLLLFSIPFWALGVFMLRKALLNKFEKNIIATEEGKIVWLRKFGRKSKRKEMAFSDLEWVKVQTFYQVNYQNVYGVEVKGKGGKWRFGVGLDSDEKEWLAAELRRACGLRSEEEILEAKLSDETGEISATALPREGWRWESKAKGKWLFTIMGLIFFTVGAVLFYHTVIGGIRDFDHSGSTIALIFDLVFILMPGFGSLIFMGVGGFLAFFGLTSSQRGTELRVYPDRVVLRKKKKRGIDEATIRRGEIREFNAFKIGHENIEERYAMEIIGDQRVFPIADWVPFSEVCQVKARMAAVLAGK